MQEIAILSAYETHVSSWGKHFCQITEGACLFEVKLTELTHWQAISTTMSSPDVRIIYPVMNVLRSVSIIFCSLIALVLTKIASSEKGGPGSIDNSRTNLFLSRNTTKINLPSPPSPPLPPTFFSKLIYPFR